MEHFDLIEKRKYYFLEKLLEIEMNEKIMTLHPDPEKIGVNINMEKYDSIKNTILAILQEQESVSFKELGIKSEIRLPDFKGSVIWYLTTVKLDLEARNVIERIPGVTPQQLRLVHSLS